MKSFLPFKNAFLALSIFLLASCESFEDVIPASDFQPLENTSVTPSNDVYYGQKIVIKGDKFIKDKGYAKVWFGGVLAKIDSYNENTLYVTVPKDAKPGILSVTNGGYIDTIEQDFRILKRNMIMYKNLYLSYGGFTSHTKTTKGRRDNYDSEFVEYTYSDTSDCNKPRYFPEKSFRSNDTVTRIDVNQALFGAGFIFYTDSAFYKVPFISFTQGYYQLYPYKLTMVEMEIDSNNKVFKKLVITQTTGTRDYGEKDIDIGTSLTLENLPYTIVDNKKIVSIKKDEVKKYITDYTFSYREVQVKYPPEFYKRTDISQVGIVNTTEQASFEMTLE